MRTPLVVGNWKMNGSLQDAEKLYRELTALSALSPRVDIAVAPPSPYLAMLVSLNLGISLAAQDCSAQTEFGAYTGEHSAEMLKSAGVEYVIVGHSERRQYHKETDELIGRKIQSVISSGLIPIYCCGELLANRDAGRHESIVEDQLRKALETINFSKQTKLVIAYEPVWAIGTGRTASAAQAQEMHLHIRKVLASVASEKVAAETRILYGGSVKPNNAVEIFSQPDVDGGLIGGAALQAADFSAIAKAAL